MRTTSVNMLRVPNEFQKAIYNMLDKDRSLRYPGLLTYPVEATISERVPSLG